MTNTLDTTALLREPLDVVELNGRKMLLAYRAVANAARTEYAGRGLYFYDLRGGDDDPGEPVCVEKHVAVNYCGTLITDAPIADIEGEPGYMDLEIYEDVYNKHGDLVDSRLVREGANFGYADDYKQISRFFKKILAKV